MLCHFKDNFSVQRLPVDNLYGFLRRKNKKKTAIHSDTLDGTLQKADLVTPELIRIGCDDVRIVVVVQQYAFKQNIIIFVDGDR